MSLCDDVAKVFVQIPPGIFSGLETLAWPIPLGVCASIGEQARKRIKSATEKLRRYRSVRNAQRRPQARRLAGALTLDTPPAVHAGKCEVACCDAGAGPEQIHLSLSGFGDQSRMGVSGALPVPPPVPWAPSPGFPDGGTPPHS